MLGLCGQSILYVPFPARLVRYVKIGLGTGAVWEGERRERCESARQALSRHADGPGGSDCKWVKECYEYKPLSKEREKARATPISLRSTSPPAATRCTCDLVLTGLTRLLQIETDSMDGRASNICSLIL